MRFSASYVISYESLETNSNTYYPENAQSTLFPAIQLSSRIQTAAE